ncbi:MAG: hypothetical protein ACRYG8_43835, partial [Janthinobacterium lividum]
MAGFWSPYEDFNEARTRLCRLADATAGPGSGVSFSDGRNICVLRQASGSGGRSLWLNILCQHVAAPPPAAAAPKSGSQGKLKAWFWRAMELEGETEIQNAQIQMAGSQAIAQEVRDHVWEPTHEFLLRHKLMADTVGIALDAIGVAAAVVFVIAAVPELAAAAAAGSLVAAAGLVTGAAASTGALVLFGIDGSIYGAEITGHEAVAKKMEDNPTIGWIRIGATIMLLPDLPVGGIRALKEIGQTASEASEALTKTAEAQRLTSNAGRDFRNVTNPSRHPAEVARQLDRVRKYQAEAMAQSRLVDAANARIRLLFTRDVALFPGATAGGAALMAAAPPDL